MTTEEQDEAHSLIDRALREDVGDGDITTEWTIPPDACATARFIAKQPGVAAGLEMAGMVFERLDPRVRMTQTMRDGDRVEIGQILAEVSGPARAILSGERTALNIVRHLSGVATLTRRYVEAVAGTGTAILDTRKTTPGMRRLEKAAVRAGGGVNHRVGLFDMVLIKDNHIAAAGGITQAIMRCRERIKPDEPVKIEVETATLEQVREAVSLPIDRIMLDNMPLDLMRRAVEIVHSDGSARRIELEASGAITLERVRDVAETGVDMISVGALTHSAPALDISLDIT
ncbi:MAG: carboxylating nicotinate-nucleotide diphosphorylase [candidate division Zixibacteria bacterium]|nr:carboxylating nicotinate-nucleotide diphosphorylase [candidate division Zixibacteria bacterium]